MGWDGFNSAVSPIAEEITASHWVDCMLKPEYRMLTASVYGYDPVQDLPNQPLGGIIVEASGRDPRYEDVEVIPPQVGVSGIKKDAGDDPYNTWNNLMAGKVIFEKLIPISWLVETKRMGYIPSTSWVRTDAQGNFDQTEIRFDIDLEPTKLLVVLDSPYNDSEMLDGLE